LEPMPDPTSPEKQAAGRTESKFEDLEQKLEAQDGGKEQQQRPTASETSAISTASTAAPEYSPGDIIEIQIYIGKWVACRVVGTGSKAGTFVVHVLPTVLYNSAAGKSDKEVPDVPTQHLRRAPCAEGHKADGAIAPASTETEKASAAGEETARGTPEMAKEAAQAEKTAAAAADEAKTTAEPQDTAADLPSVDSVAASSAADVCAVAKEDDCASSVAAPTDTAAAAAAATTAVEEQQEAEASTDSAAAADLAAPTKAAKADDETAVAEPEKADQMAERSEAQVEQTTAPTDADAKAGGAVGPEAAANDAAAAKSEEGTGENAAEAAPSTSPPVDERFTEGARVVIKDLDEKPQLNGSTGTLVEKKWKGNWIVDLDDEEGKKRRLRRRWLINSKNMDITEKPEMQKYSQGLGRPRQQYFIVGTWNDLVPRRMTWDHDRVCWTFEARVGQNGFESFQIWLERDRKKSVHPDTANAGNYVPWELRGPDADGENKNWSFGDGAEGMKFEVRLFLWADESPQSVEWSSSELEAKKKAEEESDAKEANDVNTSCKKCPRNHDLKPFKPPVDGYSCSKCKKSYPKGTPFHSCRQCDHDVCDACINGKSNDGGARVQDDARKFLSNCGDKADAVRSEAPAKPKLEALSVGDRVRITSNGPYKGRVGSVMKVDEDGDPAVRLESGEAKLFYRTDVVKETAEAAAPAAQAAAPKAAPKATPRPGTGFGPGRGGPALGRGGGAGQAGPKGMSRGRGVLSFSSY